MANEMPNPDDYSGLSRKVLQYCENFRLIAGSLCLFAAFFVLLIMRPKTVAATA